MTNTDILEVVRTAIGEVLGVAPDSIGVSDDMVDVYDIDSLELTEIGVRVENALGVRIAVEQISRMRTPADVVAYLQTVPTGADNERPAG